MSLNIRGILQYFLLCTIVEDQSSEEENDLFNSGIPRFILCYFILFIYLFCGVVRWLQTGSPGTCWFRHRWSSREPADKQVSRWFSFRSTVNGDHGLWTSRWGRWTDAVHPINFEAIGPESSRRNSMTNCVGFLLSTFSGRPMILILQRRELLA